MKSAQLEKWRNEVLSRLEALKEGSRNLPVAVSLKAIFVFEVASVYTDEAIPYRGIK